MWSYDEDYTEYSTFYEHDYNDQEEQSSDDGVDSDLEAALYGQLHHEQLDVDSPSVVFKEQLTRIDGDRTTQRETKNLVKNFENIDDEGVVLNGVTKKKKKAKSKKKDTEKGKHAEQDDDSPKKGKKRKRKNRELCTNVLEPDSLNLELNNFFQPLLTNENPKKKQRLEINSKYDYSLERRTCRVSVQNDVEDIITISSDSEKDFVTNTTEDKTLDASTNQSMDDLFEYFANYEREIENEAKVPPSKRNKRIKNKRAKNNNLINNETEDFIEISSSGSDIDCSNVTIPTDIMINVENGTRHAFRKKSSPQKTKAINSVKQKQAATPKSKKAKVSSGTDFVNNDSVAPALSGGKTAKSVENAKKKKRSSSKSRNNANLSVEDLIKQFYDSDAGEDYEVAEVIKNMTGNWHIVEHDRPQSRYDKHRYFVENKISLRCVHCKEIGHTYKMCPKIKPIPKCYFCGQPNHPAARCRKAICPQCQMPGHWVKMCPLTVRDLRSCCQLCKMPGHIVETCPDHWRRYYLTTKPGPIVQGKPEKIKKYCYNCGLKGHLGHECKKQRMSPRMLPNSPFVVSYDAAVPPQLNVNRTQEPEKKNKKKKKKCKKIIKEKQKPRKCNGNISWEEQIKGRKQKKKWKKLAQEKDPNMNEMCCATRFYMQRRRRQSWNGFPRGQVGKKTTS